MLNMLLPLGMGVGGAALSAMTQPKMQDMTANWLKDFNSSMGYDPNNRDLNYGRSSSFWNMLQNGAMNPNAWMKGAEGWGVEAGDAYRGAQQLANRDSNTIWDSFSRTQPGMIDFANQATNAAMMQNGSSMEDYAQLASRNATRGIENALAKSGGALGGAQLAALALGASEPLMQAQAQLGQMRANSFNNIFNPMAQAGYGRELNRTNEMLNVLGGAQNNMSMYGQLGANMGNLMGQHAQQTFMMPQFGRENPGFLNQIGQAMMGGGFNGFGSQAAGQDWGAALKKLLGIS